LVKTFKFNEQMPTLCRFWYFETVRKK